MMWHENNNSKVLYISWNKKYDTNFDPFSALIYPHVAEKNSLKWEKKLVVFFKMVFNTQDNLKELVNLQI